jgi:hypothetical protein
MLRSSAPDLAQGSEGLADGPAGGERHIGELMREPVSAAPLDGLDAAAAPGGGHEADPPSVLGKRRGARDQAGRLQPLDVPADGRSAQLFNAREIGDPDPRMFDDRRQQQMLQRLGSSNLR